MIAVIDANIAAALFIDLAYSSKARSALAGVSSILAPDLIFSEVANTVWKLVTSKQIQTDFGLEVLDGLDSLLTEVVPGRELATAALDLAVRLDHPAYDCFYLALSIDRSAQFYTADRRLAEAVSRYRLPGLVCDLVSS